MGLCIAIWKLNSKYSLCGYILIMLEGETLSNTSVQMKSLERTVPDTETSDTKIFRWIIDHVCRQSLFVRILERILELCIDTLISIGCCLNSWKPHTLDLYFRDGTYRWYEVLWEISVFRLSIWSDIQLTTTLTCKVTILWP